MIYNSTADDKRDVDGFLSILWATTAESYNSRNIFNFNNTWLSERCPVEWLSQLWKNYTRIHGYKVSMHTHVRRKWSWWLKKLPHFSAILVWKFTSGSMNFTNATSLKNTTHALNKGLLHIEIVIHYVRTLNSAHWLLTLWTMTVESKQLFLLHCPHTATHCFM